MGWSQFGITAQKSIVAGSIAQRARLPRALKQKRSPYNPRVAARRRLYRGLSGQILSGAPGADEIQRICSADTEPTVRVYYHLPKNYFRTPSRNAAGGARTIRFSAGRRRGLKADITGGGFAS